VLLRTMEIISKISKGTKMDQVYLPKNRHGFGIGSYVLITPLREPKETERPYFYNASIEPLKVHVIQRIFTVIDQYSTSYENIIITGSFLEKGFSFNDIDILLISEHKEEVEALTTAIEALFGTKVQLLCLSNKELLKGLSTDPIYEMMLSSCVAKKRFIYKIERKLNYKHLDLQLLKSKSIFDNFELLDGHEKWYLIRNLVCLSLFIGNKKINNEEVNKKLANALGVDKGTIKKNMLDKKPFLQKYKDLYQKTFMQILNAIKHGTKQK